MARAHMRSGELRHMRGQGSLPHGMIGRRQGRSGTQPEQDCMSDLPCRLLSIP